LILLGVTADKIENTVKSYADYDEKLLKIYRVAHLEEAVKKAKDISIHGDIVTLSPACASFDMYPNFEARGIHFKNLVKEL